MPFLQERIQTTHRVVRAADAPSPTHIAMIESVSTEFPADGPVEQTIKLRTIPVPQHIQQAADGAVRDGIEQVLFQPLDQTTKTMMADTIAQRFQAAMPNVTVTPNYYMVDTTSAATTTYLNDWVNVTINDAGQDTWRIPQINLEFNNNQIVYTMTYTYDGTVWDNFYPAREVRPINRVPKRKRTALTYHPDPAESKARRTLRDMLTEKEFRRYITNGFIMVKGESGFWYQIFNNPDNVYVWKSGKKIGGLCIHTDSSCPRTDHVINMKLLVELDEKAVWFGANQKNFTEPGLVPPPDHQSIWNVGVPANGQIIANNIALAG